MHRQLQLQDEALAAKDRQLQLQSEALAAQERKLLAQEQRLQAAAMALAEYEASHAQGLNAIMEAMKPKPR